MLSEEKVLKPCPFCGGSVKLEKAHSNRSCGVVCRNTANVGGTCCMEQVPSRSKEAAITRWNMRTPILRAAAPAGGEIFGYYDHFNDTLYRGPKAAETAKIAEKGGNKITPLHTTPQAQPCPHIVTDPEGTSHCQLAAQAQPAQDGWQLVPKEPTNAMIAAGGSVDWDDEGFSSSEVFEAMLAAAYTPSSAPAGDQDAARYRKLKPMLLAADFDYGDDHLQTLVFEIPKGSRVSADLDATLDAMPENKPATSADNGGAT